MPRIADGHGQSVGLTAFSGMGTGWFVAWDHGKEVLTYLAYRSSLDLLYYLHALGGGNFN